ncbi:MAG: polyphosphate kinase 1 [Verrucomicrobia bacterium]|nr:polyphosphate kinase 1 [Verrucomicrobiota bacterium]
MPAISPSFGPEHFINRELSWLEFNQRVLDEALDRGNPLLERVKFFCIVSSNLDEFFEVRVAGLKQKIESEVVGRTVDGLTATETFRAVTHRIRQLVEQQYACWRNDLVPALAENGIRLLGCRELDPNDLEWVRQHYNSQVRPVLTPLAIDPAHPFPQLLNKSLNVIVHLETKVSGEDRHRLAVVQVPRVLPRLVKLPRSDSRQDYVYLGRIICHHLADLFSGMKILGHWMFRVTRNSELYIDVEEEVNLLKAVEKELHNRRKGDAVRLEVEIDCPVEIRQRLLATLELTEDDLYIIDGPLNPTRIMTIYEGDHSPEIRDVPFSASVTSVLREKKDLFAAIRENDILLHHPFESFRTVIDFLEQASEDPNVLAIKQTLYRTGGDPRIVGALMNAVRNGKQVTAVVELKARFDEANNILWSRRLEEAGVHVVYGLVGYKIHCKMTLAVRRDPDAIRRYLHLSTGNYNPSTARLYTDIGLLTCREEMGEDSTNLFNLLTGLCQFQGMRQFLVAPFELHSRMLVFIQRETANATEGLPARIIAKMNALVDQQIIEALYRASQAGVKIDLIVRGICCLRPGIKGVSENISVRSIVDRFLEHSRIFYFENACQPQVYVGSADWMPRNFFGRIEVVFPILDGNLRERITSELLSISLADTERARILQRDGKYERATKKRGGVSHRSQTEFMELATGKTRSGKKSAAASRFPRVKLAANPHEPEHTKP